jgi:hypothetical protein
LAWVHFSIFLDKIEAEALYTAIADGAHGVLPWIKTQW